VPIAPEVGFPTNEDSQEIFETLNARGTPLTAADLIKNFVFQKLEQEGVDTKKAYAEEWPFERKFWETEIGMGRLHISRSSMFTKGRDEASQAAIRRGSQSFPSGQVTRTRTVGISQKNPLAGEFVHGCGVKPLSIDDET
jgi:hypothetical protein